jgi:hypothetical protein
MCKIDINNGTSTSHRTQTAEADNVTASPAQASSHLNNRGGEIASPAFTSPKTTKRKTMKKSKVKLRPRSSKGDPDSRESIANIENHLSRMQDAIGHLDDAIAKPAIARKSNPDDIPLREFSLDQEDVHPDLRHALRSNEYAPVLATWAAGWISNDADGAWFAMYERLDGLNRGREIFRVKISKFIGTDAAKRLRILIEHSPDLWRSLRETAPSLTCDGPEGQIRFGELSSLLHSAADESPFSYPVPNEDEELTRMMMERDRQLEDPAWRQRMASQVIKINPDDKSGPRFVCRICDKVHLLPDEITDHIQEVHKIAIDTAWDSDKPIADAPFEIKSSVGEIRGKLTCRCCNKAIDKWSALVKHLRDIHGVRLFTRKLDKITIEPLPGLGTGA